MFGIPGIVSSKKTASCSSVGHLFAYSSNTSVVLADLHTPSFLQTLSAHYKHIKIVKLSAPFYPSPFFKAHESTFLNHFLLSIDTQGNALVWNVNMCRVVGVFRAGSARPPLFAEFLPLHYAPADKPPEAEHPGPSETAVCILTLERTRDGSIELRLRARHFDLDEQLKVNEPETVPVVWRTNVNFGTTHFTTGLLFAPHTAPAATHALYLGTADGSILRVSLASFMNSSAQDICLDHVRDATKDARAPRLAAKRLLDLFSLPHDGLAVDSLLRLPSKDFEERLAATAGSALFLFDFRSPESRSVRLSERHRLVSSAPKYFFALSDSGKLTAFTFCNAVSVARTWDLAKQLVSESGVPEIVSASPLAPLGLKTSWEFGVVLLPSTVVKYSVEEDESGRLQGQIATALRGVGQAPSCVSMLEQRSSLSRVAIVCQQNLQIWAPTPPQLCAEYELPDDIHSCVYASPALLLCASRATLYGLFLDSHEVIDVSRQVANGSVSEIYDMTLSPSRSMVLVSSDTGAQVLSLPDLHVISFSAVPDGEGRTQRSSQLIISAAHLCWSVPVATAAGKAVFLPDGPISWSPAFDILVSFDTETNGLTFWRASIGGIMYLCECPPFLSTSRRVDAVCAGSRWFVAEHSQGELVAFDICTSDITELDSGIQIPFNGVRRDLFDSGSAPQVSVGDVSSTTHEETRKTCLRFSSVVNHQKYSSLPDGAEIPSGSRGTPLLLTASSPHTCLRTFLFSSMPLKKTKIFSTQLGENMKKSLTRNCTRPFFLALKTFGDLEPPQDDLPAPVSTKKRSSFIFKFSYVLPPGASFFGAEICEFDTQLTCLSPVLAFADGAVRLTAPNLLNFSVHLQTPLVAKFADADAASRATFSEPLPITNHLQIFPLLISARGFEVLAECVFLAPHEGDSLSFQELLGHLPAAENLVFSSRCDLSQLTALDSLYAAERARLLAQLFGMWLELDLFTTFLAAPPPASVGAVLAETQSSEDQIPVSLRADEHAAFEKAGGAAFFDPSFTPELIHRLLRTEDATRGVLVSNLLAVALAPAVAADEWTKIAKIAGMKLVHAGHVDEGIRVLSAAGWHGQAIGALHSVGHSEDALALARILRQDSDYASGVKRLEAELKRAGEHFAALCVAARLRELPL
eukprot:gnl/Chilomastix_cuspidata/1823.p1 GENE.gnl/Chilomastix_cuspidata/1823~~gnl/Chilomastix_cuspidata/1823.p1  ORF type:complete len:1147 (+),score=178.00 gnl/Chilomastix_cuspidata/1823:54-3494(+)